MPKPPHGSIRLRALFAVAAALLATPPASAQFVDCDSLYALRVALDGGLSNCDTDTLPAAVPDCGGLTANGCSELRYDQPRLDQGNPTGWPPANNPAGNPYVGKFLSKCVDGTDACAATGTGIRCMDGTRPLLYIHKAVDGTGTPMESHRWMFHTTGGGSEFRPERIWEIYRRGNPNNNDGEMSTRSTFNPPKLYERFNGLYNGNRPLDNPFAGYNRVKLDKCTFDRNSGDRDGIFTLQDPDFNAATVFTADVQIFWHGMDFWVAALNFLTRTEGRDLDGNGVLDWQNAGDPDLPSIADAEVILFTPWSGGAHGFASQADRLSDVVTTAGVDLDGDGTIDLPGLNAALAKVRVVPDGHLAPSHEVITADLLGHRLAGGSEDLYGDFFRCGSVAHPLCGAGAAATFNLPPDGNPFTDDGYGPQAYTRSHPRSWAADTYVGMGVHLDESCVGYHESDPATDDDIAPCYDSVHLFANHVETPFLIRHSLRDIAHVNSMPGGAHSRFRDAPGGPFWSWTPTAVRRWGAFQFSDIFDLLGTRSHQAGYAVARDPSCTLSGATSPHCWERAVFCPNQAGPGSHNGTEDNKQALRVRLVQCVDQNDDPADGLEHAFRSLSTADAVMQWIDGTNVGPIDAVEGRTGRIDGALVGAPAGVLDVDFAWFDRCSAAADFSNFGCVDVAALQLAGECP